MLKERMMMMLLWAERDSSSFLLFLFYIPLPPSLLLASEYFVTFSFSPCLGGEGGGHQVEMGMILSFFFSPSFLVVSY